MIFISVLCLILTIATWRLVVPRLVLADPAAPDLRQLVTRRSTAYVTCLVAAATLLAHPIETADWWLLVPYLAGGSCLAMIDLRTTFLPRSLNYLTLCSFAPGMIQHAIHAPAKAGAAVLGGLAAYGLFYLAWRMRAGLGFGDVRLALLVGMVSGQSGLDVWLMSLFAATLGGAVHGIHHTLKRSKNPQLPNYFPYGPALWAGPIFGFAISAW